MLDGVLPSEHARKRTNVLATIVWCICMLDWCIYTAINVHYKNTEDFKLLWRFNYV